MILNLLKQEPRSKRTKQEDLYKTHTEEAQNHTTTTHNTQHTTSTQREEPESGLLAPGSGLIRSKEEYYNISLCSVEDIEEPKVDLVNLELNKKMQRRVQVESIPRLCIQLYIGATAISTLQLSFLKVSSIQHSRYVDILMRRTNLNCVVDNEGHRILVC